MFYQSIKQKKRVLLFFATLPQVNISVRDGENTCDTEICDLVLCKAAESFEDEFNLTNKEQDAKAIEKFGV